VVLTPLWRDPPILGLMIGQILVWSAFSYSFPALTLAWQAEFGWTLPQVMGAFSVALFAMALSTPIAGRLIDRGLGPHLMFGGTILGAAALGVVATAPGIFGFYAAWGVIGLCMGATLYEPTFALLLRARGDAARKGITAISIVAGFASFLTFPFVHWAAETISWRMAPWTFALALVLVAAPALTFSAKKLEAEAEGAPRPEAPKTPNTHEGPTFRRLVVVFLLPAFASGLVLSQILPLLTGVGYSTATAVAMAAWIGPMQVLARLVTTIAGRMPTSLIVFTALILLGTGTLCLWIGAPAGVAAILFVTAFGAGNGLVGILRPVVVREVMGEENLGATAGAVARPALLAIAATPFLGAVLLAEGGPSVLLLLAGCAPLVAAMLVSRMQIGRT
jgi:predicted MFS family arabinose efflux permease